MSTTAIVSALPGERLIALSPRDDNEAAATWLRRPNLFPGRTLTAATLEDRQLWAAGRLAQRGQAYTPGIVEGLEVGAVWDPTVARPVGLPQVRLQIAAGRGLAVSGEDVVLPRDIDAALFGLPVVAPAGLFDPDSEQEAPGGLRARRLGDSLGRVLTDNPGALPLIGVLVLQPVTVDRAAIDPDDPCDRCGCGTAGENVSFEDWRLADAARLLWFAWPDEWRALPADTPRLRNALAYTIFDAEAALPPGATLPWEDYGVPLAVIALDGTFQPRFVDAAAVVRQGGRARVGRLQFAASPAGALSLAPNTRLPMLWQARIMQLAEQIAEAGDPPPDAATLAAAFDRLPPCGLLPTNVYDPVSGVNNFFPAGFELDAAPLPLDQLDLALREAASLASLDFSQSERVRILIPVSQESWDPRLLLREELNPEFDSTLRRFLSTRSRALGMRQALRKVIAHLTESIDGEFTVPPDIHADPAALEPEALEPWGPPSVMAGHRTQIRSGLHQHGFRQIEPTVYPWPLSLGASDSLFVWVYLDPDHPPSELMLQWFSETEDHRAYWGEDLIALGANGTSSRFHMGLLPRLGEWTRLDIPASNVGLAGQTIKGISFMLYDGRAAFGAFGQLTAGDAETAWLTGPLPSATETYGNEPWEFLAPDQLWAPFEPDFGLSYRGEWPEAAGLAALEASPALEPLSSAERTQLRNRGVQSFISYLKARADRADDLVDFGFLKVQTDIYRVRQYMLGTSTANKLMVSPMLATIAQADTAVASQEKLTAFFQELRKTVPSPRSRAAIGDSEPPTAAPRAMSTGASAAPSARALGGMQRFDTSGRAGGTFQKGPLLAEFVSTDIAPLRAPAAPTPRPSDVVNARPVVGQVDIRTTTVAERLTPLPASEARSYAAATRHDMVLGLIRLADELVAEDAGVMPGLFQDIDLWGLKDDPFLAGPAPTSVRAGSSSDTPVRSRPLADILSGDADRATWLGLLLALPSAGDENACFSDATSLSDATIALLRQVEGRVRLYRDAIAACEDTLAAIRTHLAAAQARERQLDEELAEARHDVAVTRALLTEEQQRLDAINERRAAVLAEEVRFLAYVRLRATDNLSDVPARTLDPGLFEAAIPICLSADFDIPDELGGLLRIVREAPAGWFMQGPKLIGGLDRVEVLAKTLQTAQLRSQLTTPRPIGNFERIPTGIATSMAQLAAKQSQSVGLARVAALQIDLARFTSLSWLGAQAEATQVVSLGDLIEGEHGRGDVARGAAELFDRFSRVSACLFAAFSGVLPSLRLDWAEQLSQFDTAPNLRNLAGLPRWQEIEITDRRRMQGYVDWLYGQVDTREAAATSLVNDVVRMALLLASHAPVNRIIAGRLPRPVLARPGLTIPLVALEPSRLRIGMQAMVYRANEIVARAVVEDIGSAEASARVLTAAGNAVQLDETVRVQFAAAASVSFSATAMRLF
ncbi:hypothetical protein [Methylotetracoccus oryzae]|uniref:hypothetical protein n=1 Tax=Methylotetracoccus oryzae TaxID=1919059 RepID=UPI001117BEE9|nr:hypothetical protein [Methylotetracoccus oryzae]